MSTLVRSLAIYWALALIVTASVGVIASAWEPFVGCFLGGVLAACAGTSFWLAEKWGGAS